ncbi:glycoside hydrolase family 47 protein [Schizophyllum commune]
MRPLYSPDRLPVRMIASGAAIMVGLWVLASVFGPFGERTWAARADLVRNAFVHAYNGYRRQAFGHDEVRPVSGKVVDGFNAWAVSAVDGLDTMWLMGLGDMFEEAVDLVSQQTWAMGEKHAAPFFETTIRYLGGLLSAYAMSKVEHINDVLLYNSTYADGLYPSAFDLGTGAGKNFHFSAGAAADSAYEYLLKQWLVSGRSETRVRDHYIHSANAILANLAYVSPNRELLYVTDAIRKPADKELTLPTDADMQTARGRPSHNFEHLTCFLGGLLALGARTVPDLDGREGECWVSSGNFTRSALNAPHPTFTPRDRQLHMWAAEGLTETCWATYADMPSGLGPDGVGVVSVRSFVEWRGLGTGGGPPTPWLVAVDKWERSGRPGGDKPPGARPVEPIPADVENRAQALDYKVRSNSWLLRPETIESIYLLWRTTGDPVWRERGWQLFQSMERWCRAEYGYSVVNQINTDHPRMTDEQPSWLFAETFKYLFLIFTDEDLLPLDKWVFNTEAHPLPVFEWRGWEREAYGI